MEYKNVLITGAAGFIGSNIAIHLVRKYPKTNFYGYDNLSYSATEKNVKNIVKCENFQLIIGDIKSIDFLRYVIKKFTIDAIMHFAAQTHVDNSFGNSFHFTQTNVYGTHVLLELLKEFQYQIKKFIHVSTDEVYGESSKHGTESTENSVLNPTNPYAATKAAAEFLAKSYRASFKLPIIITRGNNVYGPHQYPEKLIPKFILLLNSGKPCTIHGTGKNLRSFLHIDDVARAFEVVLMKGEPGEIYNIGTKFEVQNIQVARKIIKIMGKKEICNIIHVEDRKFNDMRYLISYEKLEKLGWKPRIDFDTGLKQTVEWYLNNFTHFNNIDQALVAHPRII